METPISQGYSAAAKGNTTTDREGLRGLGRLPGQEVVPTASGPLAPAPGRRGRRTFGSKVGRSWPP